MKRFSASEGIPSTLKLVVVFRLPLSDISRAPGVVPAYSHHSAISELSVCQLKL